MAIGCFQNCLFYGFFDSINNIIFFVIDYLDKEPILVALKC